MKALNQLNYNDKYSASTPFGGIYERILRAKDGRLVRVRFVVSEMEGRLKGHIIGVEAVEAINSASPAKQAKPLYFLTAQATEKAQAKKTLRAIPSTSHFSPYFSFEFFMSQPTRAPSRA